MKILGISAFYHDSAAAIIIDGEIIAAAQEERFSRKKHDAAFPEQAIRFCLAYAGCTLAELDAVVFYDKPFLKFERLLETYYAFSPKGWWSFITAMPVWIKEKLFLKRTIHRALAEIEKPAKQKINLLFSTHHLSHAASAFYPSPFTKAAILTIDAVGEWATASIALGEGNRITVLKELEFPHSVGLLYSAFTYYCGFTVNEGEYKLMGLAPYGNPESARTLQFISQIKTRLVDIKPDGSLLLHQQYFTYATSLRMVDDGQWEQLFGIPRRKPEAPLDQAYCDLALAIQTVTEEIVILMAKEAGRITGSRSLCLAGGVALNCVANGKLQALDLFDDLFIQPAAGDAGGAPGAALSAHYMYFDQPRLADATTDTMKGSLLGTAFSSDEIKVVAEKNSASYQYYPNEQDLLEASANLLAGGQVVGWHQGRMEFGPRALGSRSILADPRNPEMQKKLNRKIKFREDFRPFAPAVLAECAQDYFELDTASPYMLLVKKLKPALCFPLPPDFSERTVSEKLAYARSSLPAITHVDYTARIQTVDYATNPRFYALLQAFKRKTGCGLLVNTSFNVRDEPIVNTPEDAYRCFINTEMDYLVMGNLIFDKKEKTDPGR